MTMWTPTLEPEIPRYLAIADAIGRDVLEGRLQAGDRLPTQRRLARTLGVTVGTVSRGYAEAERRGLLVGEVGRGTFVRGVEAQDPWPDASDQPQAIDLSFSLPASVPEENAALSRTLSEISRDPQAGRLLNYCPRTADPRQLGIAADFLGKQGMDDLDANQILFTAGSQHGLNVALSTLFRPGQTLLTAELTYPSIKSQARAFDLRLRPVAMDHEGILPEAVDRACAQDPKPSGLYLVPTLQNPTGGVMSESRRQRLAELAEQHDLWLLEDDVHSLLLSEPPPAIRSWAPRRTVYLMSLAKCLAPGLRTGLIVPPPSLRDALLTAVHTSLWMPPPLMVELTCRWLADGTAERLIQAKRMESRQRLALARDILAGHVLRSHPDGYQVWLELPEPWFTDQFVELARRRDVVVIGAGAFAVGRRHVPHAVRLSVGRPPRRDLQKGLQILRELLKSPVAPAY